MKTFVISLVVLVILMIGINIYSSYLENTLNDIEESLNSVAELAYAKKWDGCKKETEKLVSIWSKNEPTLAMFNDHEDVDNVKLSIGELKESVFHENYEHTFKSLEVTKILLDRIKKNETLSLENILGLAHFRLLCHNML